MNWDFYMSKAKAMAKTVVDHLRAKREIMASDVYANDYKFRLIDEARQRVLSTLRDLKGEIIQKADFDAKYAKAALEAPAQDFAERTYWATAVAQEIQGMDPAKVVEHYAKVIKEGPVYRRREFERLATCELEKSHDGNLLAFQLQRLEFMDPKELGTRKDLYASRLLTEHADRLESFAIRGLAWADNGQPVEQVAQYVESIPESITEVQNMVEKAESAELLG